jgi:hypothetical protein
MAVAVMSVAGMAVAIAVAIAAAIVVAIVVAIAAATMAAATMAAATMATVGGGVDLLPEQFSAGCSLRPTIMGIPTTIRALSTITGLHQEMRWPTAGNGSNRTILGAERI